MLVIGCNWLGHIIDRLIVDSGPFPSARPECSALQGLKVVYPGCLPQVIVPWTVELSFGARHIFRLAGVLLFLFSL